LGTGQVSREFLYAEDCAGAVVRAESVYNEGAPATKLVLVAAETISKYL
jgi:nucleoside-diphosphate-sugar epimerase